MNDLSSALLAALISAIIATIISYSLIKRKVTRKDYKQEDYAKTKRPDVTISM